VRLKLPATKLLKTEDALAALERVFFRSPGEGMLLVREILREWTIATAALKVTIRSPAGDTEVAASSASISTSPLVEAAFFHEAPTYPGDGVAYAKGRRVGRRESAASGARGQPSYRASAMLLRNLVLAVQRVAEGDGADVDAYEVAALVLMLVRHRAHQRTLDTARVFTVARRARSEPPEGTARVRWLALRIRDLTRETRKTSATRE
jgi:hypothetical protein